MIDIRKHIPTFRTALLSLGWGAVVGALGTTALGYHWAYRATDTALSRTTQQMILERFSLSGRTYLWYGTVESVNTTNGTLTVRVRNRLVADPDLTTIETIATDQNTLFIRQELVRRGEYYVGSIVERSAKLTDVHSGMRIAFVVVLQDESDVERPITRASIIIFGVWPLS
ncbi:hypothetical protein HY418_03710 [Candidatus Kaiserbacteria bacterium]|nr:hypothetical protein [Candidatus Kaiserbacteria bacterium]